MQWVGLGMGPQMAGANIFIMYAAGDGNITLSPRLGKGEYMPEYNPAAKFTLLEGSGISNGVMIANVKCKSFSLSPLHVHIREPIQVTNVATRRQLQKLEWWYLEHNIFLLSLDLCLEGR